MLNELSRAWSATAAGTDSGATVTKDALAGVAWIVLEVSGHTDTDSVIQVLDGATVLAEFKIDISVEGFSFAYSGLWIGTAGGAVSVTVATSTAACQVNACGCGLP